MLLRKALLATGILVLATGFATAAERAIIVLDGSGSMWGQIDGKPKLEIARETLRTVLRSAFPDLQLGLMAYGHREKGSCSDIELLVEPAAGAGPAISDAADKMRFIGRTPLSAAVKQAAEALRYTEEKATVILITDGIETCEVDPCALASELEQGGTDFTAHVVGFGLSDEEGRQVACLAENTGGKFIQAEDAGTLAQALVQTVVAAEPATKPQAAPAPEPVPAPQATPAAQVEPEPEFNFAPTAALSDYAGDLDDDGQAWSVYKAMPDGARGERVRYEYGAWKGDNLEPGKYVVTVKLGEAVAERPVTIEAGKLSDPRFILNAGTLVLRPRPAEGEPPSSGAVTRIQHPNGQATQYGESRTVVPAGKITLTTRIGKGEVSETFTLQAGSTVEKDIIVGIGRAVATASYAPGDPVGSRDVVMNVYKATLGAGGARERVQTEYGSSTTFDLPPGDYVAAARLHQAQGEVPFSVKVGESVDVDVVLNAGVLTMTAPDAVRLEIYHAKTDPEGKRERVVTDYADTFQTTLNEGDYIVMAKYRGDKADAEKPVTVNAGERTEVTIP